MKRITSIIIILSILVITTTACNDNNYIKKSMDGTPLRPATITFYIFDNQGQDNEKILKKVAKESGLNITFDFKWVPINEYGRKIKSMLVSREKFDLFACHNSNLGSLSFSELLREGYTKDLTDLLPTYAPNISNKLYEYNMIDYIKVDGKLGIIPSVFPKAKRLVASVNKEYIDKYDIKPIRSLEDYGNFLNIIKQGEDNIIPGAINGGYKLETFAQIYDYVLLDGATNFVYKEDFKLIPWERTEEFIYSSNLLCEWFKNGYLNKKDGWTYDEVASSIIKSASALTDSGTVTRVNKHGKKVDFINYVLYPDRPAMRESIVDKLFEGALAIPVSSEHAERTLMLIDWIHESQEHYDLFMYGIKGKHYNLFGEQIDSKCRHGKWKKLFTNIDYFRFPVNPMIPNNSKEIYLEYINNKTMIVPHEGFYADYSKIKFECEKRKSLFNKKIILPLTYGGYDINLTDGIIEELKKNGVDTIVKEVQSQFDLWRREKE